MMVGQLVARLTRRAWRLTAALASCAGQPGKRDGEVARAEELGVVSLAGPVIRVDLDRFLAGRRRRPGTTVLLADGASSRTVTSRGIVTETLPSGLKTAGSPVVVAGATAGAEFGVGAGLLR